MAIQGFTQQEFENVIRTFIHPSSPIDSFEHLVDRERQLQKIEEALASPGRHIFIYGDRGAGKTSLAHTAAFKHHPSFGNPIFTACGAHTTFSSIVIDIATQLLERPVLKETQRTESRSASYSNTGFSLGGASSETEKPITVQTVNLNTATTAIKEAAETRSGRSIVVVDEFENLPRTEDRHQFAELVKQLSDRKVPVAIIFCGIGKSLSEFLAGHNSAHRYLEEVAVPSPPLSFSGRWEIIDSACDALSLTVNDDSRLRIAQVSDGFPHYIHLICQKLFWGAFRAENTIEELTPESYMDAVREALGSIESRLRTVYDDATKKDRDTYQEVLWAVADHYELQRNNKAIYEGSYRRIMHDRNRPPLEFKSFQSHLANLKSPRHGSILSSERRGWVNFTENLIRGYVRLVAESNNVRLALEHEPQRAPKSPTAYARTTSVSPTFNRPDYGKHVHNDDGE